MAERRQQTFTAACSAVGGFSYARNFTLYVELTDRDGNPTTNISYVDYKVYCSSNGSGSVNANHYLYFNINNSDKRNETVKVNVASPYANIPIASGTIEVNHTGISSIPFSAKIQASGYGVSASVSGNFALTYIPRFANITSLSVSNRTINSVTLQYTTDKSAKIFCSIDGGTTWLNEGKPFVSDTTSGTFTVYYSDVYGGTRLEPNKTYTFTVLARATDSGFNKEKTISATTYNIATITSATDFTDEANPVMTYVNPFGNNVTKLEACISLTGAIDDIPYREISKTGTSYTFNLTTEERNTLRKAATSNNLGVIFFIRTTYGNHYHSTVYRAMTIINSNPTFSNFTYQDTNSKTTALTGNNQTIIKGYSNVKATVSAANKAVAKKFASMSKYRLSIGEKTADVAYSSSEERAITINAIRSNVFTMYAIDSRGNSTAKTITASRYISYSPIQIISMDLVRTNSITSETTLNFLGYIWDGNFGNVSNAIVTCYYRYKKTTDSAWVTGETTITPVKNGTNFSYSGKIKGDLGAEGFDINNSYNIQLIVADKLSGNSSNPTTFTLGPGTPAMAIYKNNLAIGQKYDTNKQGKLQIKESSNLLNNTGNVFYMAERTDTGTKLGVGVGSGGTSHGIWSYKLNKWMIYSDGSRVYVNNYAIDGEPQIKPKTLYNNSSGTTGTITLNETSANFAFLDIFFKYGAVNECTRVENPNGKRVSLSASFTITVYKAARTQYKTVNIDGTSITNQDTGYLTISEAGTIGANVTENQIYITKVVGYR